MKWNYQDKEKWLGPFEENELKTLFLKSVINKDTLIAPENSTHSQILSACFSWALSDLVEESAHPIRRLAARFIDGYIAYFIAKLLLSMGNFSTTPEMSLDFVHYTSIIILLTLWVYLLLNATLIAAIKVSIGKWLFGIAIVTEDNNNLKLKDSIARELMAIWKPISNIINKARDNNLTKDSIVNWDQGLGSKTLYRKSDVKQYALMMIGVILMVLFYAI